MLQTVREISWNFTLSGEWSSCMDYGQAKRGREGVSPGLSIHFTTAASHFICFCNSILTEYNYITCKVNGILMCWVLLVTCCNCVCVLSSVLAILKLQLLVFSSLVISVLYAFLLFKHSLAMIDMTSIFSMLYSVFTYIILVHLFRHRRFCIV